MPEVPPRPSNEPQEPDEADELSDEEFIKKYPGTGLGWGPVTPEMADDAKIKGISERHRRLKREKPWLYPGPTAHSFRRFLPGESSGEEGVPDPAPPSPEILQQPLLRNAKGQIIDLKTMEPVREGSPEWRDLARRNLLPRNQSGE